MANSRNVLQIVIESVDRVAPGFSSVAGKVADLTQKFPLLGGIATIALDRIIQGFGSFIQASGRAYAEIVKFGDGLDDMSHRTNVAVEALSGWDHVMRLGGGSLTDFERNVTRLRMTMGQAADGAGEALDKFAALGVSATDSSGRLRPVEDVLMDISKALQDAGSDTKALADANSLLGRGPQEALGVLAEGPEAIRAALADAKRLNGEISTEFARSARAVADAQENLKTAWRGLKADIAEPINWASSLGVSAAAEAVGAIGRELDALKQKRMVGFEVFTDSGGPRAQAQQALDAQMAREASANRLAQIEGMAGALGVSLTDRVFDVDGAKFIDVKKTSDKLAKEITAAYAEAIRKASASVNLPAKSTDVLDVDLPTPFGAGRGEDFMLLEDIDALERQARGEDDKIPPSRDPDIIDAGDKALRRLIESEKERIAVLEAQNVAIEDVQLGLQNVAAESIYAFGMGETKALMFGRMIRSVVISALAEMAARLIFIKGLMAIFGFVTGAASGGTMSGDDAIWANTGATGMRIPRMAAGGGISGSGSNYFPPIILPGSPGLDRTPVLAQGGEILLSRGQVSDMETTIRKARTAPRTSGKGRLTRARVEVTTQVNRPFRTSENIALRDSTVEALNRGGRYNV